jgi:hypothetical protein
MRTYFNGVILAGVLGIAAVNAAQGPPAQPPQPPQSPRPTSTPRPLVRGSEGLVTLEGCLVHEAEIEGRIPKVGEGAGVTGDFVLTKAKVIKGTPPSTLSGMYDVDDIDRGLLESYVNQRVQIDGWFDQLDRVTSPADKAGASDNLVEIRGSAIRAIAKDCGAAN